MTPPPKTGTSKWAPATSVVGGAGALESQLRSWVRQSIRAGELTGWAQPFYGREGELSGCEVLARCPFPDGKLRSPAFFAAVLDDPFEWEQIDAAMLLAAARLASAISGRDGGARYVSWNTAPSSLTPAYVEIVRATTEACGVPPGRLCLELTEQLPPPDGLALTILRELSDLGVHLALDDIGSSHAPLRLLRDVPFDLIKLERSMIAELDVAAGRSIVEHTVKLAHDLGIEVVAEGIETEREREVALELGCDHVQGHLLGRGMSTTAFAEHLGVVVPQP